MRNVFVNNRNFRYLMTSNILGIMGITIFDMVFIIYAKSFPNPELAISIVTFISTLPYMGDFIVGYISDKTKDKIKMMINVRFFQMFLYIIFTIVVGFQQNWIIFGIVLLINFASDLSGIYTSYLSLPIVKNIVNQKDLTDARAFQSGVRNSVDLLGKLFGATLIVSLNYNYAFFGILNAMFFGFSFIVLWLNRKHFRAAISVMKIEGFKEKSNLIGIIKTFIKESKENLKILINLKQIFHFTLIFSILNLIGAAQYALLPLTYIKYESLQIGSFAFTIAVIGTVETLGIILGAFVPLSFLRKKSIESNLVLEIVFTIALVLNIVLLQDRVILLVLTFLTGYILGLSNPRIDSFIMIVTPEKSLSSVTSIFYTIIQFTLPLGSALFLSLAYIISVDLAWVLLVIIASLLLCYSFLLKTKYSTIPEKT